MLLPTPASGLSGQQPTLAPLVVLFQGQRVRQYHIVMRAVLVRHHWPLNKTQATVQYLPFALWVATSASTYLAACKTPTQPKDRPISKTTAKWTHLETVLGLSTFLMVRTTDAEHQEFRQAIPTAAKRGRHGLVLASVANPKKRLESCGNMVSLMGTAITLETTAQKNGR